MKLINLSHNDPDIFGKSLTSAGCDYISDHLEDVMEMYKSQGPTFWLRFIVTFKLHMEVKVFSSKRWLAVLMNYKLKFVKILNYVFICIHKRFIESSNTSVKTFINNLRTMAVNSPTLLNYSSDRWMTFFKSSKQLQNILQNALGLSDPCGYNGYTVLIYTLFGDFFSSLCAVFGQWYEKNNLSEEDIKKVDSKLIYWLPPSSDTIKAFCFERYLADYWKGDLQRMLLSDNIHNIFGSHETSGCCEKYGKERKLLTSEQLVKSAGKHSMELMKVMSSLNNVNDQDSEDDYSDDEDDDVQAFTEVCMRDIFLLKPHAKRSSHHENCYVKIYHSVGCTEPFMCDGTGSCVLTCETKGSSKKEQWKDGKFWKNVSIEKFPIDENKCDASTTAESYYKSIETYLHLKENTDIDNIPLSLLKQTYQHYMADFHNFDLNSRKTECLNRLRKKLTEKSQSYQCNFSQPFYRKSLLEKANQDIHKLHEEACAENNHSFVECEVKCFFERANSIAIGSSDPFGRVINFSRLSIQVPSDAPCASCEHEALMRTIEAHINVDKQKTEENNKSKSVKKQSPDSASSSHAVSQKETTKDKVIVPVDKKNDSETNADVEIDEILKLIGINEEASQTSEGSSVNHEETSQSNHSDNSSASKEAETVENFFKLIGMKSDSNCSSDIASLDSLPATHDSKSKLKVCAYCKKKETQRKMFKKCSKCKEENFPIQHYYCSQECLIDDWVESHEEEHLKHQKG